MNKDYKYYIGYIATIIVGVILTPIYAVLIASIRGIVVALEVVKDTIVFLPTALYEYEKGHIRNKLKSKESDGGKPRF
jgi:hypothetical protein